MAVLVDRLEQMLRRNDWRKAAELLVSSIGGTGFGTPGGSIYTEDSTGTYRNILDDSSGAMTVAGQLTVNGALVLGATPNFTKGYRWGTWLTKSANYQMVSGDPGVLGTGGAGGITITLQASPPTGLTVGVKKVDSGAGAVTVAPAAGTIDGAASIALGTQYESIVCYRAAFTWYVINANAGSIL